MPNDQAIACGRCNGTGTYYRASRWGSRCFGCNGTGRTICAQPINVMAAMATNERGDVVTTAAPIGASPRGERNWHEFATRYPAEAAWLQSPASGDFGQSLIKGCRRYGGLTPRQLAAVQRNVTAYEPPQPEGFLNSGNIMPRATLPEVISPPTLAEAGRDWLRSQLSAGAVYVQSTPGIRAGIADMIRLMDSGMSYVEAFTLASGQRAASVVSVAPADYTTSDGTMYQAQMRHGRPTIVIPSAAAPAPVMIEAGPVRRALDAAAASGLRKVRLDLGSVTFKLTGSRFRAGAGMIMCYENGSYAGHIDRSDVFHKAANRTVTEAMLTAFRNAAADPQAAARTHGQDTGRCSCCRRLLTDPPSVMAGIGPICQGRFFPAS